MTLAAAAIFLGIFAVTSSATTFTPMGLEEQIILSGKIFEGVISDVKSQREMTGSGEAIFTYVTFDAEKVYKGGLSETVQMRVLGGKVGADELRISGIPEFVKGQRAVVFLSGDAKEVFPVAGWTHGFLPIRSSKALGDFVTIKQPAMEAMEAYPRRRESVSGQMPLEDFRKLLIEKIKNVDTRKGD